MCPVQESVADNKWVKLLRVGMVVLFFGVCIAGAIAGLSAQRNASFIMNDATEIEAEVTDREETVKRRRRGRTRTVYTIHYSFEHPTEGQYDEWFTTSRKTFDSLEIDAKIPLYISNVDTSRYGRKVLLERQVSLGGFFRRMAIFWVLVAFGCSLVYAAAKAKLEKWTAS